MMRYLLLTRWVAWAHGQALLGNPRCPCVDPWQLPGGGAPEALTFVDLQHGKGCLKGEAGNCFPLDYGAKRCLAWDLNLAPRCADHGGTSSWNVPDSCKQPWCFVDSTCMMNYEISTLFPGYSLRYSYETCGAIDFFSTEVLVGTLKGKVLKAGVPADSPRFLKTQGNGLPTGISPDFVNHLMNQVGAVVQLEAISADSLKKFPLSTYSACTLDVALGLKDFCYGGFWETPERIAMTAFTPIYSTDLFFLVVHGDNGVDVIKLAAKTFDPFSWWLWLTLVAVVLVVGFAKWVFGEVGDMPPISGVMMGSYLASKTFMGYGSHQSSTTRSGHLLLFGFSFFCMMGLASYTANFTSFVLMSNLHKGIKDLDDAISKDVKICAIQPLTDPLIASYPKVRSLLVHQVSYDSAVTAFHAGNCGALFLPPEQLEFAYAASPPFDQHGDVGHCNLRQVGDVILAIPKAMPINRDLDHSLGYVWSREKYSGMLKRIEQKYAIPKSKCPEQDWLKEGVTPMTTGDLLGGFLVMALFLVVSIVMHVIKRFNS